jgi:DNA-binding NtrC family response regulator
VVSGPSCETHDDSLRSAGEPTERTEPQLIVALECDAPTAGAARFSLAGVNEVLIGRGTERTATREVDHGYTTLHLRLPARSVSSRHARLLRSQHRWVVEDAGSRNGSYVNGQRITRSAVGDADVIDIGRVLLLVREAMPMADAPSNLDSGALAEEPQGFRTLIPRVSADLAGLKRVAKTKVPVLLLGETGTGKEALARGIHILSARSGAIVPISCGALPPSLVEAHLFGHTKGAFSGAAREEPGYIRSSHEGTLFLDEVGELPRASQTTLLRVLQDGEVMPVGSTRATTVDLRVVSATHRALVGDDAGFRPDLYARLAGHTFHLSPLRDRIEDLGLALADLLAAHAPDRGAGITLSPEVGTMFFKHRWPMNFRELQQAVCAALALTEDGVLRGKHFPSLRAEPRTSPSVPPQAEAASAGAMSDEDERLRVVVLAHLREHEGNVRAVARAMGKAPMQIHRWMKRFGIDPNGFRRPTDA